MVSISTLKTLLFTLGPIALPQLISYYRSYRAKSVSNPAPTRPVPHRVYSSLNLLFCSCLLALVSTFPVFAPENIFVTSSSRLQTPNDVLFSRLGQNRPQGTLMPEDEMLKPRIASIDGRCLYLTYGPSVLTHCPFCRSDEPLTYLYYALPMTILPHLLHLFALGAATSSAVAGKAVSRWRTLAVVLGVGLAMTDCYMTASYDWKANSRALRAEDLDHFFWRMRIYRGLAIAIGDALFAGLIWASSTNRAFVVPPTASERTEIALQKLEGVRTRLGAIGVVRNVVVRDEVFRRKDDAHWRKDGQILSEIMDEREVVEGVRNALGSGRINVTMVEEEAKNYSEGIITSPENPLQS
ncbi:MAG: hypothetical protein LQ342_003799 [Letrouitia transgressa]|nr:MAG: hypothetical protein LQ342_003799 [Letrouitia transgressa]